MRSTNPVLSRPEAFQRVSTGYGDTAYQQPQYSQGYQQGFGQQAPYQPPMQPGQSAGVMTIDDVLLKSGITMGSLFAVAAVTFVMIPSALLFPTLDRLGHRGLRHGSGRLHASTA